MNERDIKNQEQARALYLEGKAAMSEGKYSIAAEKLLKSADLSPHFKTYEILGECFLFLEDFLQAVKYAAAAAGIGNNQFRSRFLLAKALVGIGHHDWAKDKLEEALEMKPDYRAARELLEQISNDQN